MLNDNRKKELNALLNFLGISLKDLSLLNTALTHKSYLKGNKHKNLHDNERLEFLGDAVLKLYISEYLMNKYPQYSEGELSSLRAVIVSEKVLVQVAKKINLAKYLLLAKNEKKSTPVSVIADALESLLAVVYYQCGPGKTKEFIFIHWVEYIEAIDKNKLKDNFKAVLQEYSQAIKQGLPVYKTLLEVGPDHNKLFEVAVFLNSIELARGKGHTKKDASQHAAKNALIALNKL